ncbi:MAG TPA: hydrogenase maturation protease [Ktedonosporobacter sp.]|jgi:hydrogenase expression/formation protein|nr:hydrogenase maturation protease [Ktedonosporobacter sp.]
MAVAHYAEYVTHSWYNYQQGDSVWLHPWKGETAPNYTDPQPPFEFLNTDGKYSWLKAPRYDDHAVEVGPLARIFIAYATGKAYVKEPIDAALKMLGVGASALFSTLGRDAARAIEAQMMANQLPLWLAQLEENMGRGDLRIHETEHWDQSMWPEEGFGFHEAPRGALAHWVHIKAGKVANYQTVVPTTWNGGPRDAHGQRGAYEAALIGAMEALQKRYILPECVQLVDGGTLGLDLLCYLENAEHLLILDAALTEGSPGTLLRACDDEVPAYFGIHSSPHEIALADLLAVMRLRGTEPRELVVLGMQPDTIELGWGLSESVIAHLNVLVDSAAEELRRWGLVIEEV